MDGPQSCQCGLMTSFWISASFLLDGKHLPAFNPEDSEGAPAHSHSAPLLLLPFLTRPEAGCMGLSGPWAPDGLGDASLLAGRGRPAQASGLGLAPILIGGLSVSMWVLRRWSLLNKESFLSSDAPFSWRNVLPCLTNKVQKQLR